VTNYEKGRVVDHEGSFEAGVDGAQAGLALPADPKPGMSYRQEYYKGKAEDEGAVVTVGEEQVQVPFGFFDEDVQRPRTEHWFVTGARRPGAAIEARGTARSRRRS